MIYIAYFIFLFSGIRLIIALANLLWGRFNYKSDEVSHQMVSVLIPARNEEKNIGALLKDLQEQDHTDMEVIVFDDMSDDKTADIVTGIMKSDKRIKLIRSEGLPAGWTGKNFACDSLAKEAKGKYLLFLDADVRAGKDMIRRTTLYTEKYNLGLFTIFPEQVMMSPGEWSAVPVMHYILLSLLPLVLVRRSRFSSLAAANGQFMLFHAGTYQKLVPHEIFKNNLVEDIEIARFLKRKGIKIACLSGDASIRCRMYQDFMEAVNGFSKNVINFFGNSFLLAVIFWAITTFGLFFILFSLSPLSLLFYLLLILTLRMIISYTSGQHVFRNLVYIIPQQVAIGMFILRAMMNKLKRQYEWKGRNIS